LTNFIMNTDGDHRAVPRWAQEEGATPAGPSAEERVVLAEVLSALRRLRHGTIQLQVQDGRTVQFDITEKRRM